MYLVENASVPLKPKQIRQMIIEVLEYNIPVYLNYPGSNYSGFE